MRTKEDLMKKKGGLNRRTKQWLREVQEEVAKAESLCDAGSGDCGRLDFRAATRVVEEIGERYRSFNEHECDDLTGTLFQAEDSDRPGRVKLSDFYQGLHGAWNFTETPEYLRALGALDESDGEARVVIPNYVSSRPNCLATSSLYVICCRNPCENMMAQVENTVASPLATPAQVVQALTVSSDESVTRLQGIAAGGSISLHGRAFAQWLHDEYPRSCPQPHVSSNLVEAEVVVDELAMFGDESEVPSFSVYEVEKVISSSRPYSTPRLFPCIGLLVLVGCLAAWASQDVLFDADGLLCLNQVVNSKLHKSKRTTRLLVARIAALSISLISFVFLLDVVVCDLWQANISEVVLGLITLIGLLGAAWAVASNFVRRPQKLSCVRPVAHRV